MKHKIQKIQTVMNQQKFTHTQVKVYKPYITNKTKQKKQTKHPPNKL